MHKSERIYLLSTKCNILWFFSRVASKIRKDVKKTPQSDVMKKTESPSDSTPVAQESDSDDGLEPLPFPAADEPLPDVGEEDKNEEFVLDPETGEFQSGFYVRLAL